ncbi:MAG: ribosome hibernation-promoting factor, HPF/YfiA family, partial [Lachnospirales bacterium]
NFQNKIIDKLSRIEKLYPKGSEANIILSEVKLDKKVDVTVNLPNKRIIKAEVTTNDLMSAVDEACDILERQIVKYKSRLVDKAKRSPVFADELHNMAFDNEDIESSGIEIRKNKRFFVKPMDAEEAVMEMEMLGHNFFVFRNAITDEVCVVYKRKDGAYGLIEPEF